MSNQTILTNLEVLLAAVKSQPEALFNLSSYRNDTECGTMFCTAGLAATLPHFNAQKMRWGVDAFDDPTVLIGSGSVGDDEKTDPLFGQNSWYNLFSTFGSGSRDEDLGAVNDIGERVGGYTHKELAILRIEAQIETVKGEM